MKTMIIVFLSFLSIASLAQDSWEIKLEADYDQASQSFNNLREMLKERKGDDLVCAEIEIMASAFYSMEAALGSGLIYTAPVGGVQSYCKDGYRGWYMHPYQMHYHDRIALEEALALPDSSSGWTIGSMLPDILEYLTLKGIK